MLKSLRASGTIGQTRAVFARRPRAERKGSDHRARPRRARRRRAFAPARPCRVYRLERTRSHRAARSGRLGSGLRRRGDRRARRRRRVGERTIRADGRGRRGAPFRLGQAQERECRSRSRPLVGLAPPAGTIGPVEGGADVTLRGERWTISRLSATIAGVKTNGELAYEPPAKSAAAPLANPDLALAEEAINGPAAAASRAPSAGRDGRIVLRSAAARGRARARAWAAATDESRRLLVGVEIRRRAPEPSPSRSARQRADASMRPMGSSAQGFSATLRLDKGRLDLNDMAMKIAGGAASGSVTFRRDRDSATLSGTMSAERLAINRAGFSGRIGGTLEFASTGQEPRRADRGPRRRRAVELVRRGVRPKRPGGARSRRRQIAGARGAARRDQHRLRTWTGAQQGAVEAARRRRAAFAERRNDQARTASDRPAARRRDAQRQLRSRRGCRSRRVSC